MDAYEERFQDICGVERYLARNGFVIRKFFLNVSRKEQKKRFLDRLQQPEKNWKFSVGDIRERARWDDYQHAYQEAIAATATPHAPWFVVPADNKWFTRLIVVEAMIEALDELDLRIPKMSPGEQAALEAARRQLEAEN
jgi:polyphosphate kinase 2 (PPK2 family)